jgi:mRNA interferase YafQ
MPKTIRYSARFKKDYKKIVKRGFPLNKLREVLNLLLGDDELPEQYQDHLLSGNYHGHRECHITPDWLLIYLPADDSLIVTAVRTGTHSDLF